MTIKPIAMAAISGLVIALAGMPAMAEDATKGQSMQNTPAAADSSQPAATDNAQGSSSDSNSSSNGDSAADSSTGSDEGNPDTPSGDDY